MNDEQIHETITQLVEQEHHRAVEAAFGAGAV